MLKELLHELPEQNFIIISKRYPAAIPRGTFGRISKETPKEIPTVTSRKIAETPGGIPEIKPQEPP